jgi:release factor glutamine methyltransferase
MNEAPWTVRRVLQWTTQHFTRHALDAPRLTAEVLLAHALGVDRVRLYVDLDRPLEKPELASYRGLVERRAAGEPTQYLTGQREFYQRLVHVDPRVLIPRPETELLVEVALAFLPPNAVSRVVDACTGSGCVAISVAAERPLAQLWATDLSQGACDVARANALNHGVSDRCQILHGDLFAPLEREEPFDAVLSNPPYVADPEFPGLSAEVLREPRLALEGGPDGLRLVRRLVAEAKDWLRPGGMLALEIGETQGQAVRGLLTEAGYQDVRIEQDWEKRDRVARALAP